MASTNASFDSIVVSKLPKGLIQELKQKLLGHFGGYGTVLRISCTSKNNEYTAHLQFSTASEASKAQRDGRVFGNNVMNITLSAKRPSTQLLNTRPLLLPLAPSVSSAFLNSSSSSNPKPSVQQNLKSYFGQQSSATNVNNTTATNRSILDEALRGVPADQGPSTGTSRHNNFTPTSTPSGSRESKPNTCVKLEVYTGPSTANNTKSPTSSLPSLKPLIELRPVNYAPLRPPRTLREILNLDTSQMKVVPAVNASDALACQYFLGGNPCPFPLSMMFGRTPGSVIMPVASIMQKIKPGLEIDDSTLSAIWNSIMFAVSKEIIICQAKKTLAQEKLLNDVIPDRYDKFEAAAIEEIIAASAAKEMSTEREIILACEDAMEEIISSVCRKFVDTETKSVKLISTATHKLYKKIENSVVKGIVREEASFVRHCSGVVEDILGSLYFESYLEGIAEESLKRARKSYEDEDKPTSNDSHENLTPRLNLTIDEIRDLCYLYCEEAVDTLLESDHLSRCVKVIAQEARRSVENGMDSKPTLLSQLRRSLTTPDPLQQNERAISTTFQQRALTSPNPYFCPNNAQKHDQSICMHSIDELGNTGGGSGVFSFASFRNFKRKATEWVVNGFFKRPKRESN